MGVVILFRCPAIKILIDGEENKCFKDEEINFEKEFLREDY